MSWDSVNNRAVDRAWYGTQQAALPAVGGFAAGAAVAMFDITKTGKISMSLKPGRALQLGGVGALALGGGVIAAHALPVSDDTRFKIGVGSSTLLAAGGAAALGVQAGAKGLQMAGRVGGAAVAAFAASYVINSALIANQ